MSDYEKNLNEIAGTEAFEIMISVVYSPWTKAIGSECELRNRENAIEKACEIVRDLIEANVPDDRACSLVWGGRQLKRREIE